MINRVYKNFGVYLIAFTLAFSMTSCQKAKRPVFGEEDGISREQELGVEEDLILKEDAGEVSVRVAVLLPLSGKRAKIGQIMLDSAQMALYDSKAKNIVLMPYDTKGTSFGAIESAKKAVDDGANIILGPVFTASIKSVAKIANDNNVAVITFSNNEQLKNEGVFLMGFSTTQQTERVVEYTMQNTGYLNFSGIFPNSQNGALASKTMKDRVLSAEGKVVKMTFYPNSGKDLEEHVKKVTEAFALSDEVYEQFEEAKSKAIEEEGSSKDVAFTYTDEDKIFANVLFIPEGGTKLETMAKKIPVEEYKIIGTSQWYSSKTAENSRLNGMWFVSPDPTEYQIFEESFYENYGKYPIRISSLAYDSVMVIDEVINKLDAGVEGLSKESLAGYEKFEGIDGVFRFKEDGFVERNYSILEVDNGGFSVISEARDDFSKPMDVESDRIGDILEGIEVDDNKSTTSE